MRHFGGHTFQVYLSTNTQKWTDVGAFRMKFFVDCEFSIWNGKRVSSHCRKEE